MKLDAVQTLRGIAALLVVIYHIRAIERAALEGLGYPEAALLDTILANGFAGVDLFFVISGFIMVYVAGGASRGPATAAAFLFARASRIYPLWWLFAGLMALYFWSAYGVPLDLEDAINRGQSAGEHLIASFLLLPQPNFPVLGVGWTLVHEMYFYAVFALFLLAPQRWLPVLLFGWAGAVIAGSVAGLSGSFANDLVMLAFYPMTMEFILGAMVGLLVVSGRRLFPRFMTLAGMTLLILALVYHPDPETVPQNSLTSTLQWGRVVWFGLPSAILLYGLVGLELSGRFKAATLLSALGDWSYALYLSHMLTINGVKRAFPILADLGERVAGVPPQLTNLLRLGTPGAMDNLVFLAACVLSTVIVSWLSFRFFETPLLSVFGRLRQRFFHRPGESLKPVPIRAQVW